MPFEAILFDKDGTLVDFDRTWGPAAYEVMKTLAAGDDRAFRRLAEVSGFNPRDRRFSPESPFISGQASCASVWAGALGRRDLPRLREEIAGLFRITTLAALTPIGEPASLMRRLREAGLRLGVVSNDFEISVRLQAGKLGFLDDLEFVAGRDSGFGLKPDPGMIVAFAAGTGVAPLRIAVVGDTLADMRAAQAAGAVAVAVLTGPARGEDVAKEADYVLDSVEDLPDLLDSLARTRRVSARG